MLSPDLRTVLVIGHPGHELRVFHWIEIMKPTVFVITDGSGRSRQSRLPSTTRILDQVTASKGSFYGRLTDRESYDAILNRDVDPFVSMAQELAHYLVDEQVNYVTGDAFEGYNPTHDVCRLIIDAAVEMANQVREQEVGNFDFPLTGPPDDFSGHRRNGSINLQLDDQAFERKIAAARSYAELDSEVDQAIEQNRLEAFRVECLRPAKNREKIFAPSHKAHYEQHGENRVAAGQYGHVIRYREHFLPLAEAFWLQVHKGAL